MVLDNLEWLIIIPILIAIVFYLKILKQGFLIRGFILVLLVLILLSPAIYKSHSGKDLWVLVDRSASIVDIIGPSLNETESILRKTKSYKVHDETNRAKTGDIVRFYQGRPVAKTKYMYLAAIITSSKS